MDKKYFFFDIDGTLTSSIGHGIIKPSTIATIRQLRQRGHFVAIATGRPQFMVTAIAAVFGITDYVCEGGNGIVRQNHDFIYHPMARDLADRLMDAFDRLDLTYYVQIENGPLVLGKEPFSPAFEFVAQRYEVEIDAQRLAARDFPTRRILVEHNAEKLAQIEAFDQVNYLHFIHYGHGMIEPDDKQLGIRKMMELEGANFQDVVVFGDGLNDRKMFNDAPIAVAMGNAVLELKQLADYVTADSDDEGILKACQNFGWL